MSEIEFHFIIINFFMVFSYNYLGFHYRVMKSLWTNGRISWFLLAFEVGKRTPWGPDRLIFFHLHRASRGG